MTKVPKAIIGHGGPFFLTDGSQGSISWICAQVPEKGVWSLGGFTEVPGEVFWSQIWIANGVGVLPWMEVVLSAACKCGHLHPKQRLLRVTLGNRQSRRGAFPQEN
jgi:hypothetical protein